MNSQLTDELIETLKGIKEGKEWEYLYEEQWKKPTILNAWDCLGKDWLIRLKPFAPEPPEGYRLLTEPESKCQWIEGGQFFDEKNGRWKYFPGREGCYASYRMPVAVPLTPPAPEYVPWTFETGPRDRLVWVHKKGYFTDRLIVAWRDNGVEIANYSMQMAGTLPVHLSNVVFYRDLLNDWFQEKDEPCGTIKQ